jgi:uncharacterized protein with PIN domain
MVLTTSLTIAVKMLEGTSLEQIEAYTVDLTKTRGNGQFECPKCRVLISPDDKTEDVYTILEAVMKDDRLEKIILRCNKCKSRIHLIGFNLKET